MKAWLVVYNGIQFGGWLYVAYLIVFGGGALWGGEEGGGAVLQWTGDVLVTVQLLVGSSSLEVMHVAFGMVHGGVMPTFSQVAIRSLQSFVSIPLLLDAQQRGAVFNQLAQVVTPTSLAVLLAAWTAIELVRYPFYILALLGVDFAPLTWLRYSIWIPLYPIGMLAEVGVLFGALPLIYNLSAPFYYACVALIAVAPWSMLSQLRYMARQRSSKLYGTTTSSRSEKTKAKKE